MAAALNGTARRAVLPGLKACLASVPARMPAGVLPAVASLHAPAAHSAARGTTARWMSTPGMIMQKAVARDANTRSTTETARALRGDMQLPAGVLQVVREIKKLAKHRAAEEACALRKKYAAQGFEHVAIDNATLDVCKKSFRWVPALELWSSMQSRDPDILGFTTMLSCCANALQVDMAERIWASMLEKGLTPNLITYTAMINVYGQAGLCAKAMDVFQELKSACPPDDFAFMSAMSACARSGNYADARGLFVEMTELGIAPSAGHFNCLITSCARDRHAETADAVFRMMPQYGLTPRHQDYTALISCSFEDVARCRQLLQEMKDVGLRPTSFTLQEAAAAELHAGDKERAGALITEALHSGDPITGKLRRFAAQLGIGA